MASSLASRRRWPFLGGCALLAACAFGGTESDPEGLGEASEEVLTAVSPLPDAIIRPDIDAATPGGSTALTIRLDYALGALHWTEHTSLNYVNFDTGVYRVLCNQWVGRNLQAARPVAFGALQRWTGQTSPSCSKTADFIRGLPQSGRDHWRRVGTVAEMRPGDLIAIKFARPDRRGADGHCAILIRTPTRDSRFSGAWRMRVTDSSSAAHSDDSRASGFTGVGVGTMMIRADPDSRPVDWAWTLGAGWYAAGDQIVIGRLTD